MGVSFLSTLPSLVHVPSPAIINTATLRCPSYAVSSLTFVFTNTSFSSLLMSNLVSIRIHLFFTFWVFVFAQMIRVLFVVIKLTLMLLVRMVFDEERF